MSPQLGEAPWEPRSPCQGLPLGAGGTRGGSRRARRSGTRQRSGARARFPGGGGQTAVCVRPGPRLVRAGHAAGLSPGRLHQGRGPRGWAPRPPPETLSPLPGRRAREWATLGPPRPRGRAAHCAPVGGPGQHVRGGAGPSRAPIGRRAVGGAGPQLSALRRRRRRRRRIGERGPRAAGPERRSRRAGRDGAAAAPRRTHALRGPGLGPAPPAPPRRRGRHDVPGMRLGGGGRRGGGGGGRGAAAPAPGGAARGWRWRLLRGAGRGRSWSCGRRRRGADAVGKREAGSVRTPWRPRHPRLRSRCQGPPAFSSPNQPAWAADGGQLPPSSAWATCSTTWTGTP